MICSDRNMRAITNRPYGCNVPSGSTYVPVTSVGGFSGIGAASVDTVIIPKYVTSIADNTFRNCTNIRSFDFRCSGLTTIGTYAFSGITALTAIDLPDSVNFVDSLAFYQSGLTSISIPDGITTLSGGCFWGCGHLTSVQLPDDLTDIGNYCFHNTPLTSINFPSGLKTIGESLTWTTSNKNVAAVSSTGVVKADDKQSGTAVITATTVNGLTATCTITVVKSLLKGTVGAMAATASAEAAEAQSKIGLRLTGGGYTTSKASVADVDRDGEVTFYKDGTATLEAGGCDITVKVSDGCPVEMTLYESMELKLISDGTIEWSAKNVRIADINTVGNLTAHLEGATTIIGETPNGWKIEIRIEVKQPEVAQAATEPKQAAEPVILEPEPSVTPEPTEKPTPTITPESTSASEFEPTPTPEPESTLAPEPTPAPTNAAPEACADRERDGTDTQR